jgi:hypothetical protein
MSTKKFSISNDMVQILGTLAEGTHQDANTILQEALGLYAAALKGKSEGKKLGLYEQTLQGEADITASFIVTGDWGDLSELTREDRFAVPRHSAAEME